MKKLAIFCILVQCFTIASVAEEKEAVKVWVENDNYQAYNISAQPVVKHIDGKIVMSVKGKALGEYEIYDGMKLTFGKKAQPGNVNGDEGITMADANTIVNKYLGAEVANINVTACDVNGDQQITMADANSTVNLYLGSE